jgi:hypothetical protein
MAHFAKLDENNVVTQVLVVNNDVLIDEEGQEQESIGVEFLNDTFGEDNWKQCSYNSKFRGLFPGIGSIYLPEHDIFSTPKPYDSWVLDTSTGRYSPPVEAPEFDRFTHYLDWNEEDVKWVIIEIPKREEPNTGSR